MRSKIGYEMDGPVQEGGAFLNEIVWIAVGTILGVLALALGFLISLARATSPTHYYLRSFVELQRYFAVWAPLLDERGDIFVGVPGLTDLIQFRKKRFKSRPDELIYRFRNSGRPKRFFDDAVKVLTSIGTDFELELTKKRRFPRAAIIRLTAEDVLMPSEAVRLCEATFAGLGRGHRDGIVVHCSGRFRSDVELSGLEEIPSCPADVGRYGFSGIVMILLRPLIRRRDR